MCNGGDVDSCLLVVGSAICYVLQARQFLAKRRIEVINSYCVIRIAHIVLCERILIQSLG